jgi:hypothetical protein
MAEHEHPVPYPDRKISETFLLFAAPLIHPEGGSQHRYEAIMQVAFTAWNAVIHADLLGDDYHLKLVRTLMSNNPESSSLIEGLIERKRELFGDDPRMIGKYQVTKTEDGINLRAEAVDPYSLKLRETDTGVES